jgi:hypothetical protein
MDWCIVRYEDDFCNGSSAGEANKPTPADGFEDKKKLVVSLSVYLGQVDVVKVALLSPSVGISEQPCSFVLPAKPHY